MSLSCLNGLQAPIVIDASVAINLNGTGNAEGILEALPNTVILTDIVVGELRDDARSQRNDGAELERLISRGIVQIAEVGKLRDVIFETLLMGSGPNTLDDGEAATIAYAIELGAIPILDEKKGHRICGERYPAVTVGNTVDVLAHPAVEHTLSRPVLADYVFNALQFSRMRVFSHHTDWVIRLIGPERARSCLSLPRAVREQTKQEEKAG
jgi:predicted nucleic acid-binding protein